MARRIRRRLQVQLGRKSKVWKRWCSGHKAASVAIVVLVVLYSAGIFADIVAPYDPLAQDLARTNELPSGDHWFGTDRLGRDLFSRTLFALRTTIAITAATFFVGAGLMGVFLGIISGYVRGLTDNIIMRVGETLSLLPALLFMILISATVRSQYDKILEDVIEMDFAVWMRGDGFFIVLVLMITLFALSRAPLFPLARVLSAVAAVALALVTLLFWLISIEGFSDFFLIFLAMLAFSWFGTARFIRAQVLLLREKEFILAAKAVGVSDGRIITHHIFPNVLNLVIVGMSMGLAVTAGSEIALTWLGLGIQPPTASFGAMLSDAGSVRSLATTPHLMLVPSAVIMLFMFAWNMIGDALSSDVSVIRRS